MVIIYILVFNYTIMFFPTLERGVVARIRGLSSPHWGSK